MPESLPKAMTEPVNVIAPMKAPSASSTRLPPGIAPPFSVIANAHGSATAATAMKTAAKPIMLWKNATSSGIFVISTRLAMIAPTPPPTTRPSSTQTMPSPEPASLTISAAVVNAAMAMPTMPNRLPRIDVVGCDRPLSA